MRTGHPRRSESPPVDMYLYTNTRSQEAWLKGFAAKTDKFLAYDFNLFNKVFEYIYAHLRAYEGQ